METRGSFPLGMVVPSAKPPNPAEMLAESNGILEWLVEERYVES